MTSHFLALLLFALPLAAAEKAAPVPEVLVDVYSGFQCPLFPALLV